MSVCIPKNIACDWYSPEDGSPPDFIAGTEACILQVKSETRARFIFNNGSPAELHIRSIGFGAYYNGINVQLNVYDSGSPVFKTPYFYIGNLPDCGTLGTIGIVTKELLELVVTLPTGLITYYYACQEINMGSPPVCIENGTENLRDVVNSDPNQKIEIPLSDNGWSNNQCMLTAFSGNLSGGTPNSPGFREYRTGPILTMIYIDKSENQNGTETGVGNFGLRYWNGACWKFFDNINPECCGGSPLICDGISATCELGPESDC